MSNWIYHPIGDQVRPEFIEVSGGRCDRRRRSTKICMIVFSWFALYHLALRVSYWNCQGFFVCETMRNAFLPNVYEKPLQIVVVATSHLIANVNKAFLKNKQKHTVSLAAKVRLRMEELGLLLWFPSKEVGVRYWPITSSEGFMTFQGQERTLLIVVGCTSAEGNEKSQYREKVFCYGVKDQVRVRVHQATTYGVG